LQTREKQLAYVPYTGRPTSQERKCIARSLGHKWPDSNSRTSTQQTKKQLTVSSSFHHRYFYILKTLKTYENVLILTTECRCLFLPNLLTVNFSDIFSTPSLLIVLYFICLFIFRKFLFFGGFTFALIVDNARAFFL